MKTLSIVVPVYNEEVYISKTLAEVLAVAMPGIKKQIIVIDDGSKDKTAAVLIQFKKKHKLKANIEAVS